MLSLYEGKFYWKEKNGQIEGLISNMLLFLCYTAQLVISNLCTKFNNPKSSNCLEILDGRSPYTLHRSERWNNRKFEKEGKINISNLIFFYTIYLVTPRCIQSLKTQAPLEVEQVAQRATIAHLRTGKYF